MPRRACETGAELDPQNIYDDPDFFAGYSRLERFGTGWTRAMEHAELLALLPDTHARRILDLGCGAGQLAHHLAVRGAAEVVGVDVSERMLAMARSEFAHPRITYSQSAIEHIVFPDARFELVVSVLALHYVDDYLGLMRRIAGWLTPGGTLVYSIEHPIYTGRVSSGEGWALDSTGRRTAWGVDRYADEGAREETWFVAGVRKVHRTFSTLVNGILDAGLTLERVLEPMPTERWLRDHPQFVDERRRPMFLMLRARKP
jgi:ubiquinone/menaquinone biosynthesis C-methylase UbiE